MRIINECKNEDNKKYTGYLLTNKYAIEAEIALEGARILSELKKSLNIKYVYYVLSDEFAIKSGKVLEMAKNIATTNSIQEARILTEQFIKESYDNYLKELINNSSEGEEIRPADLVGKIRTLKQIYI